MRFVAFVLCAVACARNPRPTGPKKGSSTGYVLVSRGAWLRSHGDDKAPGARAYQLQGAVTDEDNLEQVWVLRLVGEQGDWVEVENIQSPESESHCYGAVGGLEGYRLRLFVRRGDLVPVTARESNVEYSDTTGFTLSAGVAMGLDFKGMRRVAVDGVHAWVKVPEADIGVAYAGPTARLLSKAEEDAMGGEMPVGKLIVGGSDLNLSNDKYTHTVLAKREREPSDGKELVSVRTRCSKYVALIDAGAWGVSGVGMAGLYGRGVTDLPQIRKDAPLFWPDGSPAGQTLDQMQVQWGANDANGMHCFRVPLRAVSDMPDSDNPEAEWMLTVCVKPDDWIPGFGG